MAATLTVPTIFTAVDRVTAIVDRMTKAVGAFGSKAQKAFGIGNGWFKKLTPSIGGASQQLLRFANTAALAGAVLGGITFGGKALIDYEVALHSLQAVTGETYKTFQGQIESIASRTHKSAIDVAGSFEVIGSAMSQYLKSPKELGMISEAGITLSKASRQELIPTLENLTSIMNQFKLEAKDSFAVINRLTAGEIVGNMRTSEVATALQEFGAGAKLANVNLGESVALVEVLGRQMQHATVGNAAKNIMIIMDSAKGLAKRARKELTKNGVNMDVLMSHTIPLGVRLKELSKILNDSVAMTKVFGRENKTAGQVILSNLKTYEDWEKQIQKTNAANMQAAANADTVANRWTELKNTFSNYITSNDRANKGLMRLKTIIKYVTDNMDDLISRVITAVKWYAAIRGTLFLVGGAMKLYNLYTAASIALATTAAATTATQTVVVTGFGSALVGVTGELGAANLAATGFFATLSGFAIPAALTALAGLALYKTFAGDGKKMAGDVKTETFNRKTPGGKLNKFGNKFEENGYQNWFKKLGKTAKSKAELSKLTRDRFDSIYGAEYNKVGDQLSKLFAPKTSSEPVFSGHSNTLPVLPPTGILTSQQGQSSPATKIQSHWLGIDIIDPNGLVGGTTQTGPRPIPVKVTSTKGVR